MTYLYQFYAATRSSLEDHQKRWIIGMYVEREEEGDRKRESRNSMLSLRFDDDDDDMFIDFELLSSMIPSR